MNDLALTKVIEPRYTITEACEMLRLSERTVREAIRRGRLGHYRLTGDGTGKTKAGRVFVGASHLQDYLKRFEIKATATATN